MQRFLSLFLFLVPICLVNVSAQKPTFYYELKGVIQDETSAVVPSLRLLVNGNAETSTDINGRFSLMLPAGEFVLTSDLVNPEKFRAFVKITEKGVNPAYLTLTVSSRDISCFVNQNSKELPKVFITSEPVYPAAARATNAEGEVAVLISINDFGKVVSAKASRGHPLLRRAAEMAAEKFEFDLRDRNPIREVQVIFLFIVKPPEKANPSRYTCPYRIIVYAPMTVIDF